jgi:glycerol-3-phosphate acyltransferase PlsY
VLVLAAALAGYLLGTFPTADLLTRIVTHGRVDVRAVGTGNPGGLNAMVAAGRASGVAVIVLDMAKGAAGALAGWAIGGSGGAYAGATAAVVGHVLPVWSRLRGGKGVATAGGAVLAVFPFGFAIGAVAVAAGALATRRAERAVWCAGGTWVAAALEWWLAGLPNGWGPDPTVGLPIGAAVASALVVGKFRLARPHRDRSDRDPAVAPETNLSAWEQR